MIAHDRIPWVRMRGHGRPVDHAVASYVGGWWTTVCCHWTPSASPIDKPERKCRACVAFLKTANLVEKAP